jgi:hypothetical protein
MANHRTKTPAPAQAWHRDGGSQHGCELNYLPIFYYPEECTLELGPTELLPGAPLLLALGSVGRAQAHGRPGLADSGQLPGQTGGPLRFSLHADLAIVSVNDQERSLFSLLHDPLREGLNGRR